MSRIGILVLAFAFCIFTYLPQSAQAFTGIMNDWQAYYDPCPDLVAADCTACHQNGFNLNSYGDDLLGFMDDGMNNEEAFAAAEPLDSDGDGYTNGQEIVVDCTFPWDASDHGTVAADDATWGQIKSLYR